MRDPRTKARGLALGVGLCAVAIADANAGAAGFCAEAAERLLEAALCATAGLDI